MEKICEMDHVQLKNVGLPKPYYPCPKCAEHIKVKKTDKGILRFCKNCGYEILVED